MGGRWRGLLLWHCICQWPCAQAAWELAKGNTSTSSSKFGYAFSKLPILTTCSLLAWLPRESLVQSSEIFGFILLCLGAHTLLYSFHGFWSSGLGSLHPPCSWSRILYLNDFGALQWVFCLSDLYAFQLIRFQMLLSPKYSTRYSSASLPTECTNW